jgi:DNA-binding transcriptional ArsR family regulator
MIRQATRGGEVFRAVADPTRRGLLDLLRERERSVTELRACFRMSQPAISQHLDVLRRARLVRARRDGRRRLYELNAKPIEEVFRWAAGYKAFFDPQGHAWAFRSAAGGRKGPENNA